MDLVISDPPLSTLAILSLYHIYNEYYIMLNYIIPTYTMAPSSANSPAARSTLAEAERAPPKG